MFEAVRAWNFWLQERREWEVETAVGSVECAGCGFGRFGCDCTRSVYFHARVYASTRAKSVCVAFFSLDHVLICASSMNLGYPLDFRYIRWGGRLLRLVDHVSPRPESGRAGSSRVEACATSVRRKRGHGAVAVGELGGGGGGIEVGEDTFLAAAFCRPTRPGVFR